MNYPKLNKILLSLLLIVSMFFYFGCSEDDGVTEAEGSGTISMKIADDPFPIDFVSRAEITVDQVEVRNADETEGNYHIIMNDTRTYNLIDFRNGLTADLPDAVVPAGSYNQVRLRVIDAEIELTNGQTYNLNVPSGASSGLKVFINPALEVNSNATYEVLLDFDLTKSFVARGNIETAAGINGFNFKPVIRAVTLSSAGSISGTVTDNSNIAVEGAHVWVVQDSVVSSTYSESDGSYSIIGLPSGTYDVHAEMDGYSSASYEGIDVESGADTDVDFQLIQ